MAKKTGGKAYDDMTLDELDEFEDEEDDRVMQQYRYGNPYPTPCVCASVQVPISHAVCVLQYRPHHVC